MLYLLVDYGASYIKCIVYDTVTNKLFDAKSFHSPFGDRDSLAKENVMGSIRGLLYQYEYIENVVICSILGGFYNSNDIYYSWKAQHSDSNYKGCLISELFKGQETYHVHKHHLQDSPVEGLQPLGVIDGVTFYSALGDTNCVIESVDLVDGDALINLGTGSQIISLEGITSFIPSGRALNMFDKFFNSLGVDFFKKCNSLTFNHIDNSSMVIDLAVFKQANGYNGGGYIQHIHEDNFTVDNMIASIIKAYTWQYIHRVDGKYNRIFLTGGISKNLPVVGSYIAYKTNIPVTVLNTKFESTHLGMVKLIKKYL